MKRNIFFIINFFLSSIFLLGVFPVMAAQEKLVISYEPSAPNFTAGQQNVVTAVVTAPSAISATTLSFKSTDGVKIVSVLDAMGSDNKPVTNIKYIRQGVTDSATKITLLVMRATADLPSVLKIPIVITGEKSGRLQVNLKESQSTDGNGSMYILSQPKGSDISISASGKDTVIPPTPTSLSVNTQSVNLTMKFQGMNPATVKTKTLSGVKVQLVQGNVLSLPQFITVTMDEGGLWRGSAVFPNIKPGINYAILIKGPKHLQKRMCANDAQEQKEGSYMCNGGTIKLDAQNTTVNASGITLMTGDVGIQDGILNSYDLSFMQNTIKKTAKNSASDADLNNDGKVDKTDYDLLIYSLQNTRGQDQK